MIPLLTPSTSSSLLTKWRGSWPNGKGTSTFVDRSANCCCKGFLSKGIRSPLTPLRASPPHVHRFLNVSILWFGPPTGHLDCFADLRFLKHLTCMQRKNSLDSMFKRSNSRTCAVRSLSCSFQFLSYPSTDHLIELCPVVSMAFYSLISSVNKVPPWVFKKTMNRKVRWKIERKRARKKLTVRTVKNYFLIYPLFENQKNVWPKHL